MTREDALSTILLYVKHSASNDLYKDLIEQIFNDHEAQLEKYIELGEKQALEFDRFFDAFGLKSENISIDDAINFFKAKDEENKRLKAEVQYYIELEAGEDL